MKIALSLSIFSLFSLSLSLSLILSLFLSLSFTLFLFFSLSFSLSLSYSLLLSLSLSLSFSLFFFDPLPKNSGIELGKIEIFYLLQFCKMCSMLLQRLDLYFSKLFYHSSYQKPLRRRLLYNITGLHTVTQKKMGSIAVGQEFSRLLDSG
jgi:hypothetical protein